MTPLLMTAIVHCYVGCSTGSAEGQALHVLECDTDTGSAKIVQSVTGIQGTTYFQFDRDGRYLYSVLGETHAGKSVGQIVRFAMDDWRIGRMERLAALPCETPCHVSLTPDGRRVAFAAYSSATAGTIRTDGTDLRTFVFPNDAMGPNKQRQTKAFAHQTFYLPDGTLGVVDLGCDRIWFFDAETMRRKGALEIKAAAGGGPRHAVVSNDNRFLFVLNELSSTVAAYALPSFPPLPDAPRPDFSRIGEWSMLPAGFSRWEPDGATLATKAAAIKLTADGQILMASNRGHDSIAFYSVAADGSLALKNVAKLTGRFPRDFELMPGEKFMVVGHKMSNEIQVYRFDRTACTLTPVGAAIPAWRPLCFKFGLR
ncbi:MAG: beta-propeller fold lactonase family protein [Kiritimatiellia bacterium]